MLSKITADQVYLGNFGWHSARFHFSFADYQDPNNNSFGDLITFNDFFLDPLSGFDMHPHSEIEIISYCLEGILVHEDDMGNRATMLRGDMQYTCAGSGITHSERNGSKDKPLRFIQIWIRPDNAGLPPIYRCNHYGQEDRLNRLLQIASAKPAVHGVAINQDTDIFVSEISAGRNIQIDSPPGRQIYLSCLEGSLLINETPLASGDAMRIWDEAALNLTAVEDAHILLIEMPRDI